MIDILAIPHGNWIGWFALGLMGIPILNIFSFFRYSGAYITYSLLNWRKKRNLVSKSTCCYLFTLQENFIQRRSSSMGSLPYDSWRRLLATVSLHHHEWCHWSCKIKSDSLIFFRSLEKLKEESQNGKRQMIQWFCSISFLKKNPTFYTCYFCHWLYLFYFILCCL